MKKHLLLLCLGIGLHLLAGAQPALRLVAEAPEAYRAMGREYIALSNDGLQLELGFDGFFGEYLVFDLLVYNSGPEERILDPSDFHYQLLDNPDADSSPMPSFAATHPQFILKQYEHMLARHEKRRGTNAFIGILETSLGVLSAAGGFAATEDPGFIIDGIFQTVGTAGYYSSLNKGIGQEMALIHEEKELVDREIFTRDSLMPGELRSGFVFFPVFEQPGYLMFCFPMDDQLFQFVYRQEAGELP